MMKRVNRINHQDDLKEVLSSALKEALKDSQCEDLQESKLHMLISTNSPIQFGAHFK